MIVERVSSAGFRHLTKAATLRRAHQIFVTSNGRIRECSSHNVDQNKDTIGKATNFHTVYAFPYIHPASFLCKFKIYQTGIVVFLTAISLTTENNVQIALIVCTVSLAMLGIMGEFFRKLVGFMYLDPKGELVKISHLTFWGNRKDGVFPIASIVPLSDTAEDASDVFFKLNFYDKKQPSFYLSLKYGKVLDKDMLHQILGQLK